jgi:hypothetical protein
MIENVLYQRAFNLMDVNIGMRKVKNTNLVFKKLNIFYFSKKEKMQHLEYKSEIYSGKSWTKKLSFYRNHDLPSVITNDGGLLIYRWDGIKRNKRLPIYLTNKSKKVICDSFYQTIFSDGNRYSGFIL